MSKSTSCRKSRRTIHFVLILSLLYYCTPPTHQLIQIDANNLEVENQRDSDPELLGLISPYKLKMESEMNEILGTVKTKLYKSSPESPMGNWVADAILDYMHSKDYNIDLSVANSGGLRINEIVEGPLTKGTIYELCPFDNYIVVMEMDTSLLTTFFEHMIQSGGWPISRDWEITTSNQRILSIKYEGKPLDDRIYKVALPDYVANGGSDTHMLVGKPYDNSSIYYRDALIEQAKLQNKKENGISSKIENRIIIQ